MTVRAVLRRTVGAQWPILAGVNFWRRGALLIGIGVGVAAVLRLVLSEERAGLLVVRSKGIDFVTTVTVAAAMVYIASTIDPLGTARTGYLSPAPVVPLPTDPGAADHGAAKLATDPIDVLRFPRSRPLVCVMPR